MGFNLSRHVFIILQPLWKFLVRPKPSASEQSPSKPYVQLSPEALACCRRITERWEALLARKEAEEAQRQVKP
jgi:hypothetical protein